MATEGDNSLYIAENKEPVDLVSPLKYGGTIEDKQVKLEYFLHDFIVDKSDYYVFLGLLRTVFNDIKSVADDFENLADVNNVVSIFLPKLSFLMDYTFHYDLPDEVNRDIIKRLLYIYKQKGTDKEVLEAADFANNPNWIASTLFVPTEKEPFPQPDDRTSKITYPVTMLFTHCVSKHNGLHHYSDETRWRDGVIVIEAENVNQLVRNAVKRVLPAGLKAYYESMSELKSDGENGEPIGYGRSLKFKEWVLNMRYTLDYFLRLESDIQSISWSQGSINYGKVFSGKQMLFPFYELDKIYVSSMLPLYGDKVYDIFEFIHTLESALPSSVVYKADSNLDTSINYINITNGITGNNSVINSITNSSKINAFGISHRSGRFVFNSLLDDTEESDTSIVDIDSGDTSEGTSTQVDNSDLDKLKVVISTLKNPTQTEILSLYRNIMYERYSKIFSPWTDVPIHDISSYEVQPFVLTKHYKGLPTYSSKASFSGKYSLSGLGNTLYIQAKCEHILPEHDYHFTGEDVADRVPVLETYESDKMDSLGYNNEEIKYDIHIYKNMVYRGLIDVEYYNPNSAIVMDSYLSDNVDLLNETKTYSDVTLKDLVGDNTYFESTILRKSKDEPDTLFNRKLSDFAIVEISEAIPFSEIKMKNLLQIKDREESVRVSDVKLDIPYGNIRYIVMRRIDNARKYLEDHKNDDVNVSYLTDYGKRSIGETLLSERFLDSDKFIEFKTYETLYNKGLNSLDSENNMIKEYKLADLVETFNYVEEKPLSEMKIQRVIFPSKTHNKAFLRDKLFDRINDRFINELHLNDLVKVME